MNLYKADTCRSCLQTDTFLISIFDVYNDYSISKILADVTGLTVNGLSLPLAISAPGNT